MTHPLAEKARKAAIDNDTTWSYETSRILREAAAELDHQAEMRAALKPFAVYYEALAEQMRFQKADSDIYDAVDADGPYAKLTYGDFRAAIRALKVQGEKG